MSPLLLAAGKSHLSEETQKSCHLALARMALGKKTRTIGDARLAIAHLLGGDSLAAAGTILYQVYVALAEAGPDADDQGVLLFWPPGSMPEGLSLAQRITLRSLQTRLLHDRDRPFKEYLDELLVLTESAGPEDAPALAVAGLTAGILARHIGSSAATCLVVRAVNANPGLTIPQPSPPLVGPQEGGLEMLLWSTSMAARTPAEIEEWLLAVGSMHADARSRLVEADNTAGFSRTLAHGLWRAEYDKPAAEQRWDVVLVAVAGLRKRAAELGAHRMCAHIAASEMLVLADSCDDLNAALALAEKALRSFDSNPACRFVICERAGSLCRDASKDDLARKWLDSAIEVDATACPLDRMLLLRNRAAVATDAKGAVHYAASAADSIDETVSNTEAVKTLGELAIAHWRNNDLASCFDAFEMAITRLLEGEEDTTAWRDTVVLASHALNYIANIAENGHPPMAIANEQEQVAPWQGAFMSTNEDRPALYAEWRYVGLFLNLCRFACGLGDIAKTREWSLKGMAAAEGRKAGVTQSLLAGYSWPFLIDDGKLGEALIHTYEAYAFMKVMADAKVAGRSMESLMDADKSAIQVGAGSNYEAERLAAVLVVPPSLFLIGSTLLVSRDDAVRQAQELADACDMMARSSGISEYWATLSSHLREFVAQPPDGTKARASATTHQGDDDRALLAPCEIGPAIHGELPLADTLRVHLQWARLVDQYATMGRIRPSAFELTVAPYLSRYWLDTLSKRRFAFGCPSLLKSDLESLEDAEPGRRAKQTLRAVAQSLRAPLSGNWRDWFSADNTPAS
jgi:hypothetical protein